MLRFNHSSRTRARQLLIFLLCAGPAWWAAVHASNTIYTAQNTLPTTASSSLNGPEAVYITTQWLAPTDTGYDLFTGMATFAAGAVVSSGGTLWLDTFGRFSGPLVFGDSSAKLYLTKDMLCGSNFSIDSSTGPGGVIQAYDDVVIRLTGDLTLSSALSLYNGSSLTIDGGGRTVTIGPSCTLTIGGVATTTLHLRNMSLVLASSTPFSFGSSTSALMLTNVNLILDDCSPSIDTGQLQCGGNVTLFGNGQRLSVAQLSLADHATLTVGANTTLALQGYDTIAHGGTNSTLHLDACTLDATSAGLHLSGITLKASNQVLIKATNQEVLLGDASISPDDVPFKVLAGAYVIVDGKLHHNPGFW